LHDLPDFGAAGAAPDYGYKKEGYQREERADDSGVD
jgi:hypothetical protein